MSSRKIGRLPLRIALPLSVAMLLLLVVATGLWGAWENSVAALEESSNARLRDELYRLARHASDHSEEQPVEIWQDIGHAATQPLVREVAFIDRHAQVQQAHRRSWTGQAAAQVIAGWDAQRMAASLAQRGPVIHWDPVRWQLSGLLSYQRPVFDPRQLRQLEPAVVYVQLDLNREREALAVAQLRARLPELLAIGALMLLLAAWLKARVARPLDALARTSRRWADGDLSVRAEERGPAEIARMAQAFNQMASALLSSQNDLKASKEHLSTILYSTGDALLAVDVQQRITLLNPSAERLTGWREHEARGRPLAEVFRIEHAHTGEPAEIPVQRVLETGLVVGLANHTVLVSRSGQRIHVADSAAPVRDGTGAMQGVVLVFRDVSQAYRLEQALAESEHHYRSLANAGHALQWTTDLDGRGIWCNNAWLAFTGLSLEAARSAGWLSAVHADELDGALVAWRHAVETGQTFQLVLRLRRHDGAHRSMLIEGVPRLSSNGLRMGHVLLAVDITGEREADSRMLAQLDELRRWHAAVIGREERIAELKAEVNSLLVRNGQAPRYGSTASAPAAPWPASGHDREPANAGPKP